MEAVKKILQKRKCKSVQRGEDVNASRLCVPKKNAGDGDAGLTGSRLMRRGDETRMRLTGNRSRPSRRYGKGETTMNMTPPDPYGEPLRAEAQRLAAAMDQAKVLLNGEGPVVHDRRPHRRGAGDAGHAAPAAEAH
jgi:hypothetical protein